MKFWFIFSQFDLILSLYQIESTLIQLSAVLAVQKKPPMEKMSPQVHKPSSTESRLVSTLLEIRSNSVGSQKDLVSEPVGFAVNKSVASPNASKMPAPTTVPAARQVAPPVQIQQPVSIQPGLYGMSQGFDASRAFAPHQLAAIQAAAAAEVASFGATTAAASNQMRALNNLYPMVHSGAPTIQQIHASIQQQAAAANQQRIEYHHLPDATSSERAAHWPESDVRVEKIEDAMRSKPQRGRKRVNLNDTERLELTRTRNREHAKSTRVRKKARYQELLDNEKLLSDFQVADSIKGQRRQCIMDFLAIRERMLHNERPCDESSGSDGTGHGAKTDAPDSSTSLQDVVENIETFSFSTGTTSRRATSAQSQMKKFDVVLASRLRNNIGESTFPLLAYQVDGSTDGIALSSGDTAFAEVRLMTCDLSIPEVWKGVLQFQFAPKSYKLLEVVWTSTSELQGNQACERLEEQVSHPSVVSLDPLLSCALTAGIIREVTGDKDKAALAEDGNGPGMNI